MKRSYGVRFTWSLEGVQGFQKYVEVLRAGVEALLEIEALPSLLECTDCPVSVVTCHEKEAGYSSLLSGILGMG